MNLCQIDIPDFDGPRALGAMRAYLTDRFPEILDVLPTPAPETIVIGYRGEERVEAWAVAIGEQLLRRIPPPARRRIGSRAA